MQKNYKLKSNILKIMLALVALSFHRGYITSEHSSTNIYGTMNSLCVTKLAFHIQLILFPRRQENH